MINFNDYLDRIALIHLHPIDWDSIAFPVPKKTDSNKDNKILVFLLGSVCISTGPASDKNKKRPTFAHFFFLIQISDWPFKQKMACSC